LQFKELYNSALYNSHYFNYCFQFPLSYFFYQIKTSIYTL